MRTILVANPKGGSGKTTLATNIAGWLAGKRQRVGLLDADPQCSSTQWLERRPALFPSVAGFARDVGRKELKDVGPEWLVVDSPAGLHGDDLRDALKRADALVVPVSPSAFDMAATRHFLEAIREHKSVREHGLPIAIKRGYVGVDTRLRGQAYRFVTTHLETQEMAIQSGQAAELLVALAATPTDRALILVGDMNSSPADIGPADTPGVVPPYRQFLSAGLVDVWAARFGEAGGFTCCQDSTLRNEVSTLDQRIDLIMARAQPLLVRQVRVLLDDPALRTAAPPGQARLWPSDHAGFEALLGFRGRVPTP